MNNLWVKNAADMHYLHVFCVCAMENPYENHVYTCEQMRLPHISR